MTDTPGFGTHNYWSALRGWLTHLHRGAKMRVVRREPWGFDWYVVTWRAR